MSWYTDIIKKRLRVENPVSIKIEDGDEITDEIEKSLWVIKEELDLPTEEIEISLESRRASRIQFRHVNDKHR